MDYLRWEIAVCLHTDIEDGTNLTEVISPLVRAWIARAGDRDVPLAERLKDGAPAGITQQPENVGVFPTSVSPPSEEFALSFWGGSEVNYVSMEESPYSGKFYQD